MKTFILILKLYCCIFLKKNFYQNNKNKSKNIIDNYEFLLAQNACKISSVCC